MHYKKIVFFAAFWFALLLFCFAHVSRSVAETSEKLDKVDNEMFLLSESLVSLHSEVEDLKKEHRDRIRRVEEKMALLEQSIDPADARWTRIKKVRDVVKMSTEEHQIPKRMGTQELTRYASAVVDYSEEFDIPPALILAVTRTESAFNPRAVSHAGAIGAMQLMPSTASDVSNELGIRHYSMYKVKDNVRFGTYYLMRLLDMFEGNVSVAIKAYNCGPTCAKKVESGELDHYPTETILYEEKILGTRQQKGFYQYYLEMGL